MASQLSDTGFQRALDKAFSSAMTLGGLQGDVIGFSLGSLLNTVQSSDITGPGSSVDSQIALFSGITGTVLKVASGTGFAQLTSGVLSVTTTPTFTSVATNTIAASSASVVAINGAPTDASNAIGVQLGSSTVLANASAKLVSIKNSGTEKAFFDKDGSAAVNAILNVNNSVIAMQFSGTDLILKSTASGTSGNVYISNQAEHFGLFNNSGLTLEAGNILSSTVVDGASAKAIVVNSGSAFTTSGAKLLSLQNNGSEQAYVDKDGKIVTGSGMQTGAVGFVSTGNPAQFYGTGAKTFVYGDANDGASAVGITVGAGNVLSTSGAKLVSFANNLSSGTATEKAYIDKDGGFVSVGGLGYGINGNSANTQGLFTSGSNTFVTQPTGGVLAFRHSNSGTNLLIADPVGDGAGSVNIITNTSAAYTTAGAKLLSVQNNSVEKFAVDKDGNLIPGSDEGATLGTTSKRWTYLYTDGLRDNVPNTRVGIPAGSNNTYVDNIASPGATSVAHEFLTNFTFSTAGGKLARWKNLSTEKFAIDLSGKIIQNFTDISGTPGSGTINNPTGRAAIASTTSAATITNSTVTSTSIILLQIESDGTGVANVVVDTISNGSFIVKTINGTGIVTVTTSTTKFSFCVLN